MNRCKILKIIVIVNLLLLSSLVNLVGSAKAAAVPSGEMTELSVAKLATGLENVTPAQTTLTTKPRLLLPPAAPSEKPLLNSTAVLTITKSAEPDPVNAGEVLTYTIVVANGAITDATDTVITDTLDESKVSFAWASHSGVYNSGVVTWNTGTITGEQTITRTLLVTVGTSVTSGTLLSNTAGVTSTEGATDSDTVTTMVNTSADLTLTKTDTPDPVQHSGNLLTYNLTVTNNGPSDATGVTLTDDLPTGIAFYPLGSTPSCSETSGTVTCNLGTITSGSSELVVIRTLTTLPGIFTNQAEVTANEPDPVPDNNIATEETTVEHTNLSVTKTDSPDPVLVGSPLTYWLTIANNGPNLATNVVLTDILPSSVTFQSYEAGTSICTHASGTVTCNLGNLLNGYDRVVTIVVTPTTVGTIVNTAEVTADQPDLYPTNNVATETTTVDPVTDLIISKSDSPDPVIAGESLNYTLTITNNGPSDATDIIVTDTLPSGVTFNPTGSSPECTDNSGTVNCTLSNLADGANTTFTIKVDVASSKTGTLSNSASVTGNEFDPNTANNDSGDITTTVDTEADLSISKSDAPDPVTAGENLTYSLTIINNGPSDATGIVVTDTLSGDVNFTSASPGCINNSGTVNCTLTNLTSGLNKTFTIEVKVDSSKTGTLSNSASVTSDVSDPNPANNDSGDIYTTVNAEADLVIDKVGPSTAKAGDPITYTLTINNNGPSDATGVVVTDTLPMNAAFLYASPGCSLDVDRVICNFGTLTEGDIDTATIVITSTLTVSITNSAEVGSNTTDPNSGNNTNSADTMITDPAADMFFVYLPIVLKAPPTELSVWNDNTGGNLTFTVLGTNPLVSCTVANNTTQFCGSFIPGTYTVRVERLCPPSPVTTGITYVSGPRTMHVFCP